jgi:hypothetical protein
MPRPNQWNLSKDMKTSYKTVEISYWGSKRYILDINVWRKKVFYPLEIKDKIKSYGDREFLDGSREVSERDGKIYVNKSYEFLCFKLSVSYFVSK